MADDPKGTPNPQPTPPNPPPAGTPTLEELQEQLRKRDLELTEARTEANAAKQQLDERNRRELEETGNYKELATQLQKDLETERERTSTALINSSLSSYAEAAGISDVSLIGLIPRDGIKVENGIVTGAKEAIEAYKTSKPLLFQRTPTQSATGSTQTPSPPPGADDQGPNVKNLKPEQYREQKNAFLSGLRRAK